MSRTSQKGSTGTHIVQTRVRRHKHGTLSGSTLFVYKIFLLKKVIKGLKHSPVAFCCWLMLTLLHCLARVIFMQQMIYTIRDLRLSSLCGGSFLILVNYHLTLV